MYIVWDCCSKQDANCLQALFNYACGIALCRPRLSSSVLWNDLGLSSLSTRRKLHLAQLMFKCHISLAPPYLSSVFHKPSHRYSTHNSNLVNLPPVRSSYGQCSLSFLGVPLCRSLPLSIRNSDSLVAFTRAATAFYYLNWLLVCEHLHGHK